MQMGKRFAVLIAVFGCLLNLPATGNAAARKVHVVAVGSFKRVPYSRLGDPAGAAMGEDSLRIRPLVVDGLVKEWTSGEAHDVTDRSFVVRRVLRINDELPGEKLVKPGGHWVWQRGPWLLVDRITGHIAALKLPDYDPAVSQAIWFRDYAAYCGLPANGKSLYAVVAQVAARKPVLAKKLNAFEPASRTGPTCAATEWQREPLRATFHPAGMDATTFDIVAGSVVLVEDSDSEPDAAPAPKADQ